MLFRYYYTYYTGIVVVCLYIRVCVCVCIGTRENNELGWERIRTWPWANVKSKGCAIADWCERLAVNRNNIRLSACHVSDLSAVYSQTCGWLSIYETRTDLPCKNENKHNWCNIVLIYIYIYTSVHVYIIIIIHFVLPTSVVDRSNSDLVTFHTVIIVFLFRIPLGIVDYL